VTSLTSVNLRKVVSVLYNVFLLTLAVATGLDPGVHMVCTHRRGEKHAAEVLTSGRNARSIVLRNGYSLAGYSVVLLRSEPSSVVLS
jgi:hypothetical protein